MKPIEEIDNHISQHIAKLHGNLSIASVEHFVKTGKITGDFRSALHRFFNVASHAVTVDEQYEECLSILILLVRCKEIKDNPSPTEEEKHFYELTKPLAWMKAKAFLTL